MVISNSGGGTGMSFSSLVALALGRSRSSPSTPALRPSMQTQSLPPSELAQRVESVSTKSLNSSTVRFVKGSGDNSAPTTAVDTLERGERYRSDAAMLRKAKERFNRLARGKAAETCTEDGNTALDDATGQPFGYWPVAASA